MKIAIDVMGGDHGPNEIIKGALKARDEGIEIVLFGKEASLNTSEISELGVETVFAEDVITMDDKPTVRKENSSMVKGIKAVSNGEADAFVSAGNTGALMARSFLQYKAIKGIHRPAIATTIPRKNGFFILLDSGANADNKSEHLYQFGKMGACYSRILTGKERPKVGLFNIGTEKYKGLKSIQESHELFNAHAQKDTFEFVGNVEGNSLFFQDIDVVVCDGFTGNSLLKTLEGFAGFVTGMVKDQIFKNVSDQQSAMNILMSLKKDLDYSEYGGAPLLGVNQITIKSHGSSNSNAIYNAVKIADKLASKNIIEIIRNDVSA